MSMYKIISHIEGIKYRHGQTVAVGWAFAARPGGQASFREIEIQVLEGGRPAADAQVTWIQRPDIRAAFFACQEAGGAEEEGDRFGFRLSFPSRPESSCLLTLTVRGEKRPAVSYAIRNGRARLAGWQGVRQAGKEWLKKLAGRGETVQAPAGGQRSSRGEAGGQPCQKAAEPQIREEDPLISLIVPVYCPDPADFQEMVESVMGQSYGKWELCLADGSGGKAGPGVSYDRLAAEASGKDIRVRYQRLEKNLGISGNTNQALGMAAGQWIAMMDHDDLLEPDALWEAVKALRSHPKAGFLYTDSDLTDGDGMKCFSPLRKPDWSPETMYSANYITHFSMIRRDIVEKAGGFDSGMDGAQDWDMFLKAAELSEEILHVPRVLYHWRMAGTSTARSIETKPYALDAQLRAIQAHFCRMGWQGRAFFQDRSRYLIRVQWDRQAAWKMIGPDGLELGNGAEEEPQVYLVSFGNTEPAGEEACRELAMWAVHEGIGLVFPKLLAADGRIQSAGMVMTAGGAGEMGKTQTPEGQAVSADRAFGLEELYHGQENHMADEWGNTDWYRNVAVQGPALFAVSAEHVRRFGFLKKGRPEEVMAEYACRLARAGLRHLMNPFAEVVCGPEYPAASGTETGNYYIRQLAAGRDSRPGQEE